MNDTRPYLAVVNEIIGEDMPIETNIFLTALRREVWSHDLAESVVGYVK